MPANVPMALMPMFVFPMTIVPMIVPMMVIFLPVLIPVDDRQLEMLVIIEFGTQMIVSLFLVKTSRQLSGTIDAILELVAIRTLDRPETFSTKSRNFETGLVVGLESCSGTETLSFTRFDGSFAGIQARTRTRKNRWRFRRTIWLRGRTRRFE